MEVAIGLLRVYMKHGVVDETALTPLFLYFFKSFPNLSEEERMNIFINVTGMTKTNMYANTWMDLDFPVDESGGPLHSHFA